MFNKITTLFAFCSANIVELWIYVKELCTRCGIQQYGGKVQMQMKNFWLLYGLKQSRFAWTKKVLCKCAQKLSSELDKGTQKKWKPSTFVDIVPNVSLIQNLFFRGVCINSLKHFNFYFWNVMWKMHFHCSLPFEMENKLRTSEKIKNLASYWWELFQIYMDEDQELIVHRKNCIKCDIRKFDCNQGKPNGKVTVGHFLKT